MKNTKTYIGRTTSCNGHPFEEEDERELDSRGLDLQYVPHQNGDSTTECNGEVFTVLNTPIENVEHAGEICIASQDVLVTSNSGTRVIQNGVDFDDDVEKLIQRTHGDDNLTNGHIGEEVGVKSGSQSGRVDAGYQPSMESAGYVSGRPDMEAGKMIPPKVSLLGENFE